MTVGNRVFKAMSNFDTIWDAAMDAHIWGFPRKVCIDELSGWWFRYGEDIVFWFERHPEEDAHLGLHLAVSPKIHGHWPVKAWFEGVKQLAIDKGADRLRFTPFGDDRDGKVPDYLKRIGWVEREDGLEYLLEAS